MTKLLRLSLLLLAVCACGIANAANETDKFTASALGITGTSYADLTDFQLSSTAKYSLNAATNKATCVQLRSKNSNSGIVTTTSGGTVKKITVVWNEATKAGQKLDVYGSTSAYGSPKDLYDAKTQGTKIGTIENGKSTELSVEGTYTHVGLRSNNGAVYATEISIEWEPAAPGTVAMPTITGNATFETSTTVTITGPEGADIYYTTDDSTPTTSSQKYTAPFSLTESTTVNAIAVKGGKSSTVASKDFSKITCTDATLEEVVGWTADKTYVKLALNNAKVIYADGNTVHLRENGKCLMLYNVGILALTLNSTVSGSIKMNFKSYNGIPEMMKNEFTNAGDLSITAGSSLELDATVTTVEDLLAKKNLCDLVLLKNVTVTAEGTGKDAKYFIVSGAKKIQLWGNQNLSAVGVGKSLDIYALCNSIYSNNVQIKPVKVGDITLGINNTIVVESKKQGIYNINGVKMSEGQTLPAGLYIKNGKKVIVK